MPDPSITTLRPNRQEAPFPLPLADLVARLVYWEGYEATLEDIDRSHGDERLASIGLTLCVLVTSTDAYRNVPRRVMHYFPVPPATYDLQSWRRWLFDRLGDVELHERMEGFRFVPEGTSADVDPRSIPVDRLERPLAPNHAPGRDPYVLWDYADDVQRRTTFQGTVKED